MLDFSGLLLPILLSAALNLDRQVLGPFALSRPLMSGFFLGLMLDSLPYGVWMGLSVELLWLAALPLGGQVIPNAGLAVSAVLIAWAGSVFSLPVGGARPEAGLVLSFLSVPLWAWAFTFIDQGVRRLVPRQLAAAEADLAAGRDPRFFSRNFSGLIFTFLLSIAALALAVESNILLLNLAARWGSGPVLFNLGFLFTFVPFLGLLAMAVFLETKTLGFYFAGLLASLLALSAVH